MSEEVCANCMGPMDLPENLEDVTLILETIFCPGSIKDHQEDKNENCCKMCQRCEDVLMELHKLYEQFSQLCQYESVVYKKYMRISRRRYNGPEDALELELKNGKTNNVEYNSIRNSNSRLKEKKVLRTSRQKKINDEPNAKTANIFQLESSSVCESLSLTPSEDTSFDNTLPGASILIEDIKVEMDSDNESSTNYGSNLGQGELSDEDHYEDDEFMKPFVIKPDKPFEDEDSAILLQEKQPKRIRGRPRKSIVQGILLQDDQPKRGRGRPRKAVLQGITDETQNPVLPGQKRGRGRPRKVETSTLHVESEDSLITENEVEVPRINAKRVKTKTEYVPDSESHESSSDSYNSDELKGIKKKKRGRPKKIHQNISDKPPHMKRKRGRTSNFSIKKKDEDDKNETDGVFKCPHCGKEATSKCNLKLHIQCVHEKAKKFQCSACGKRFFHKNFLTIHTKRFHEGETPKAAFVCQEPDCGRSFAYPAGLRNHAYFHKPDIELPFSCEVCGKKYRRHCDLTYHMSKHTDDKPFICEQCGSFFKTKHNLYKHLVSQHPHEKNKPPPNCHICGKVLRNMYNLKIHIQTIHEGQKPFQCEMCGASFTSSSNLKVHYRGVHQRNGTDNNDPMKETSPCQSAGFSKDNHNHLKNTSTESPTSTPDETEHSFTEMI